MPTTLFKIVFLILLLNGCTTGHLEYLNAKGEKRIACETEYTWQPSVDKHAVEYVLSYCAKKAANKGYTVLDERLLHLDTRIPNPPDNKQWSYKLAKSLHNQNKLTDKEYGYVIAYIDLKPSSAIRN
ncbi:hypothetical protein [Flocculibacter collagenilyticus]|uniref:hypothetical protein n=1 Tax=Flocculibacter collagenilyticus TaxID=2744479 RepID=UPI0018F75ED0|nr:hypothetical protein [Flocculibacter collagenilyticus]